MIDGFKVYDAHMHHSGIFLPKGTSILDYMDSNGIDGAVVNTLNTQANLSSFTSQDPGSIKQQAKDPGYELFKDFRLAGQPDHAMVDQILKKAPGRVFPFFWYNPADPADGDQQRGLSKLQGALDRGYKGVKIQLAMTPCPVARLDPVARLAADASVPVFVHLSSGLLAGAGKTDPFDIAELARRNPRTTFIVGHAASTMEFCIETVVATVGLKNVIFETSVSILYGIMVYVKLFGPDRVVFGSDSPAACPFMTEYQKMRALDFPPDVKQKMLAGNLERILHLPREQG